MMILIFCLVLFAAVILIAYGIKALLLLFTPEKIANKYASTADKNSVFVKKYKEANVEYYKGAFLRIGLIVVIGMLLAAFNWQPKEEDTVVLEDIGEYEEIEVEPPPTSQQQPPPPPPPPPPPEIQVVEDDEIIEEDPIIQEAEVDVEEVVQVVVEAPKIEIEEPEPEPEEPEIFTIVEEQASFPGGQAALFEYLGKNIRYPAIARENGIEGTVYVKFVVNRDGSISDIQILKDIGGGCGAEAVRVIQSMPKWNPGKQRGKPVRVYFNLPVRFTLQ